MADKIVYTLVNRPGGVDGRDASNKGGNIAGAFFSREEATKHGAAPWCDVVPIVVNEATARREAMAKLSAVDKLVLGLTR